ncbi:MAG: single-stranded DNA-binding protein [Bdellovibrio sp.]|nr:single-stranded DNA-binding protein [Bdellovibrio sp.]
MLDINKVILVGRLGGNPISRKTKSGLAVTHFSLATSRKFEKEAIPTEGGPNEPRTSESVESQKTEETQWHQIVSWGKLAESNAQYLRKGNAVYVEGSIRSHSYKDKQGNEKTAFEIHAETISYLYTKNGTEKVTPALTA